MKSVPEGTLVASRYRVKRELGRGGMGAVFLVEHVHTGAHLALKLLLGQAAADPGALERFKREARASARINSDHVVRVLDADVAPELDGAPFIVMELLDGCDLERLVASRGKLPPAQVVALLAQAARALDKSHALGIIHRDLKPENLFLHRREDGSEMLKVVDFGISKLLDSHGGAGAISVTSSGTMMGTPLYMSPEQAKGQLAEIGPATDVWAIGLVAVRLLTSESYWTARSIAELMVQVLQDGMAPPSTRWGWLPKKFDAWFARSCARVPAERFQTVGAQVTSLADALGLPADIGRSPSADATPGLLTESTDVSPYAETIDDARLPPAEHRTASDAARSVAPPSDTTKPARRGRALLAAGAIGAALVTAAIVVRSVDPASAPPTLVGDGATGSGVASSASSSSSVSIPATASNAGDTDDARADSAAASAHRGPDASAPAPRSSTATAPPKASAPASAPVATQSASARGYAPTTL